MNNTLLIVITVIFVIFVIFGISATVYSYQKCGAKAFLLGNGAFFAAKSGLCD